jgi:hypothetical protein
LTISQENEENASPDRGGSEWSDIKIASSKHATAEFPKFNAKDVSNINNSTTTDKTWKAFSPSKINSNRRLLVEPRGFAYEIGKLN